MNINNGVFFCSIISISMMNGMDQKTVELWRDRCALKMVLDGGNMYDAKTILDQNKDVLNSAKGDFFLKEINAAFTNQFCIIPSDAFEYQHYLKDFVYYDFNLDVFNAMGEPLLCMVTGMPDQEKYLDLLKGGAYVNIKDNNGYTPLLYAASQSNIKKISKLLLYGATVNAHEYWALDNAHPMSQKIKKLYFKQNCYVCNSHQYNLFHIPCVNRHLGNFLCTQCYAEMGEKKCPICLRGLGVFYC